MTFAAACDSGSVRTVTEDQPEIQFGRHEYLHFLNFRLRLHQTPLALCWLYIAASMGEQPRSREPELLLKGQTVRESDINKGKEDHYGTICD